MHHPSLACAPADLLLEITSFLEYRSDLHSLCLTSKSFFSNIAPALYQTVVLTSAQQCIATLGMLKRRTDVARHVRELVISPSRAPTSDSEQSILDSRAASAAVAEIAALKCLDALSKFTWFDNDIAYHEEMWLALRMCCPRLRYLSTSVGAFFPASSHLFNFTDLLGFSIFLAPGFYENNTETLLDGMTSSALVGWVPKFPTEGWPPSKKLWDMLFKRCPNLEELVIEGYSSFPADARCLVDGRWPNLHKLSLGDISVDWTPASQNLKSPFTTFLEAHPELHSLGLSRHNIDPAQLNSLNPDALKLTSFSGTLAQLQGISPSYPSLKSLTFRDPVWSRDTATTIANILKRLTSLTELTVTFMLHSPYDSSSILRELISSCPQLHSLHLSCLRKTFQLDGLAKAVASFRRLRTLNLTLVSAGDLSLPAAGARLALANPCLKTLELAFVPPSYPHALPRRRWYPLPQTKKHSARFTVVCDQYVLPAELQVRESETTVWPWPWLWGRGARRTVKQYTIELRPGVWRRQGQGSADSILGILLEKSPAGQEIRMFALCSLLVLFAGAFAIRG